MPREAENALPTQSSGLESIVQHDPLPPSAQSRVRGLLLRFSLHIGARAESSPTLTAGRRGSRLNPERSSFLSSSRNTGEAQLNGGCAPILNAKVSLLIGPMRLCLTRWAWCNRCLQ